MTMNYKILGKDGRELYSETGLHPGEVLELELAARGLKKMNVAAELGIKPGHLSELLSQKRHLSASMALKLEQLLSIDAEFWLRVQSGFDLEQARKKVKMKSAHGRRRQTKV